MLRPPNLQLWWPRTPYTFTPSEIAYDLLSYHEQLDVRPGDSAYPVRGDNGYAYIVCLEDNEVVEAYQVLKPYWSLDRGGIAPKDQDTASIVELELDGIPRDEALAHARAARDDSDVLTIRWCLIDRHSRYSGDYLRGGPFDLRVARYHYAGQPEREIHRRLGHLPALHRADLELWRPGSFGMFEIPYAYIAHCNGDEIVAAWEVRLPLWRVTIVDVAPFPDIPKVMTVWRTTLPAKEARAIVRAISLDTVPDIEQLPWRAVRPRPEPERTPPPFGLAGIERRVGNGPLLQNARRFLEGSV